MVKRLASKIADWSGVLVELVCLAAISVGVGMIYVPAGLIVAGVLGVAGMQAYAHASRSPEVEEIARKLREARQRRAAS